MSGAETGTGGGVRTVPGRAEPRVAGASIALGVGVLAQVVIRRGMPVVGTMLFLVAVVLFVVSAPRAEHAGLEAPSAAAPARSRRDRLLGAIPALLCAAATIASLVLFATDRPPASAWGLHLASVASFLAAARGLPARRSSGPALSKGVLLAFFGILALGAAFRFYALSGIPYGCWWDEANNGSIAERITTSDSGRPVYAGDAQLPTHFFYLVAGSFRIFGPSLLGVRAVTAAFGLATVLLAFLVGREAHGDRFGLVLAFLTAASRWNVTFSRIGLVAIPAPFFALLALLLLLRARRYRTAFLHALAGVAVGLGLCFYFAFRLFIFTLLAYAIVRIIETARSPEPGRWRNLLASAALFALGTALACAPVLEFATRHPAAFVARTSEVSIFHLRDEPDLGKALVANTRRHLLMFHGEGDRNGRHNLPGAPMLDTVTGALMVLGLGAALVRRRSFGDLLFLVGFPAGLLGGILSLDFEAPQSARAILAMPSVLYLAALGAEGVLRSLSRTPLRLRRAAIPAVILLAGGAIAFENGETYFIRQARSDGSWMEHSAPSTIAARRVAALAPTATIYASRYLENDVVVRFLAPDAPPAEPLTQEKGFPLRPEGSCDAAIMVDPDSLWVVDRALRLYPRAKVTTYRSPAGTVALKEVVVVSSDLLATQGLDVRYTTEGGGEAKAVGDLSGSPLPSSPPPSRPFDAEWRGTLEAPLYGTYALELVSSGTASLFVDGELLASTAGDRRVWRRLAQGSHALLVQGKGLSAPPRLLWRPGGETHTAPTATVPLTALFRDPPIAARGLLAEYSAKDEMTRPEVARIEPFLDTYFHQTPLPRPYFARYRAILDAPSEGDYQVELHVQGHRAQVVLDGRGLIDLPEPGTKSATAHLAKGPHPLVVTFRDDVDRSELRLYWTPPLGHREAIPGDAFRPVPLARDTAP